MMNVLYIDGVGPFGGASRSLFEVVKIMKDKGVAPYFVCARGTALDVYSRVAIELFVTRGLSRFDNTCYSRYRGVRWLVVLRELYHLPFTLIALLRASRLLRGHINLIHVNEVTEIIPGLLAKYLFGVPMVVHVRSPQNNDRKSLRTCFLHRVLKDYADTIVAINETTRNTLPRWLSVDVIQNSFTAKRSISADEKMLFKLSNLRKSSLKVGFVGNLQISKGIFDLLEAARILKASGSDVEFVIVGGYSREDGGLKGLLMKKLGLAQNVREELEHRINLYDLGNSFHLFGATFDIQCVYESIDVIAFPSHFDAPGRPVFEAAFSAVPSIVSISRPLPDTLIEGETGLAIPAHNPEAIAQALSYFEGDRSEITRMGVNARQLAVRNFDPCSNAILLKSLYERVLKAHYGGRKK